MAITTTRLLSFPKTAQLKNEYYSDNMLLSRYLCLFGHTEYGRRETYINSLGNVLLELSADHFGARPDRLFH